QVRRVVAKRGEAGDERGGARDRVVGVGPDLSVGMLLDALQPLHGHLLGGGRGLGDGGHGEDADERARQQGEEQTMHFRTSSAVNGTGGGARRRSGVSLSASKRVA